MDEANSPNGPLWKRLVVLVGAVGVGLLANRLTSPPLTSASFWSFLLWLAMCFVVGQLGGKLLGLPKGWRLWGGSRRRVTTPPPAPADDQTRPPGHPGRP